jgi:hypothetical protein
MLHTAPEYEGRGLWAKRGTAPAAIMTAGLGGWAPSGVSGGGTRDGTPHPARGAAFPKKSATCSGRGLRCTLAYTERDRTV